MAKDRKAKVRGFYFEYDGDADDLKEGLHILGSAFSKALAQPQVIVRKALPADEEIIDAEVVEAEEGDGQDGKASSTTTSKNTRSKKRNYKVVDVRPQENAEQLATFAEKYMVDTLQDKALLAVHWLHECCGLVEVNADQIFTCFKLQNWRNPSDYTTLLKDMVDKPKKLDRGSATGLYRINLNGSNVLRNLKKANGD